MAQPNLGVRLYPEPLRSIGFSDISETYARLGTALSNPSRILHLVNSTDGFVFISFDGVTDHDVLPPSGFLLLDITANMTEMAGALNIAQGQQIYVASPGVTSGAVYLATYFATGTI